MRRAAVLAAWAGLLSVELVVALTYRAYGTWWHWLLHHLIGWGVGLAIAALFAVATRRHVPVVLALVVGQFASIVPDLMFRFLRMPHEASMDLWLGHISIHTGPSPVLVALGALLIGGTAYSSSAYGRRRTSVALAVGALLLVTVACLLARDTPTRLSDYPLDPPRLVTLPVLHLETFPGDKSAEPSYASVTVERRWSDT